MARDLSNRICRPAALAFASSLWLRSRADLSRARVLQLPEEGPQQEGRTGRGAEEPGLAVDEVGALQPRLGQRLLQGAERVDPVRREPAQELPVDREPVWPAPVAPVGCGKGEALERARHLDGQVGVAEELHPLEAVPEPAQAIQDGRTFVPDAGDETQAGDDGQRRHAGGPLNPSGEGRACGG